MFARLNVPGDVEGARAVGIRPVWLSRDGADPLPDVPTIRTLDALPAVVRAMSARTRDPSP